MRILITGIAGFLGSHLAEHIVREGKGDVFGTVLSKESLENVAHLKDRITLIECDITDALQMEKAVKKANSDLVFHFAGQANVYLSWSIPKKTMEVNTIGSLNLLEAVRKHSPNARVLLSSTREVYGGVKKSELPTTEKAKPAPMNPYAVSKLAMEELGRNYIEKYGLKVIITRSFNITGPGRPAAFVCSDWAKQLAEIELGLRKPVIETGSTNVVRDFTDARDAVRAYLLAIKKCKPGEIYNLCSGKGREMGTVLKMVVSLSSKKIDTRTKQGKVVKVDVPFAHGSNAKLRKATGWKPEIPFEQTLDDLEAWWEEELGH